MYTVVEMEPPVYTVAGPPTTDTPMYDVIGGGRSPPPKPTPFAASFIQKIPLKLPISLDDLGIHIASCHSDGNAAFGNQYKVITHHKALNGLTVTQDLYSGEDKPCSVGLREEHKPLNRFKNITPCMCVDMCLFS